MGINRQRRLQKEVFRAGLNFNKNYKVIVLNDDFNTFEHVSQCLMKYIPQMTEELAWELTNQVHFNGLAIAWAGPLEQAEFYHAQLKQAGLTMAPLETE